MTKAVSRVSSTTVRNRTIARVPTRLKARATLFPMTRVTRVISSESRISVVRKDGSGLRSPRRQAIGKARRSPDGRLTEFGRGPEPQQGSCNRVSGRRRHQQEFLSFGLEAMCLDPGAHRLGLQFEPVGEALLPHQPDGPRAGAFGFIEKV